MHPPVPETLALLEAGELTLCTLAMIEPILNEENAASILPRVQGASFRDVAKVTNEFRPPLHLRDRIRPVRVALNEPIEVDQLMFEREIARALPEDRRVLKTRITDKLYVQFLADEALVTKFEQAKALLCGRRNDLSFAEVFDVLLTEFLSRRSPSARHARRQAKTRDQQVATPNVGSEANEKADKTVHTPSVGSGARRVPAAVRDEVYVRDDGRCTFRGANGTRCEAKKGLEIDHIVPVAAGGTNDPANLRLLCPAHNLRSAEQALGAHVMAAFWRQE